MATASAADKHIFNENLHHYYSVGLAMPIDRVRSDGAMRNAYQSCSALGARNAMKLKNKNIWMRRTPTSTVQTRHMPSRGVFGSRVSIAVEIAFELVLDGHVTFRGMLDATARSR